MQVINTLLGTPLGYLMYLCYRAAGNYGLAIILFTILTRVLLFPLSLMSQKNALIMAGIQPALSDIKRRNQGNSRLMAEEQKALFKKEGYSSLKSLLPLLVQIPVILGLIQVIYHPLDHLLRLDPASIAALL
ncbi:MAG TPA: YidC/Oxa1 family membrane protein insertase, partial [Clostridiaceae bacterium]|nr:YidC/Oxa1 family membrane protein insertase [Clostridiaceae bacterium]